MFRLLRVCFSAPSMRWLNDALDADCQAISSGWAALLIVCQFALVAAAALATARSRYAAAQAVLHAEMMVPPSSGQ